MFAKYYAAILSLTALTVAAPSHEGRHASSSSQCDTGKQLCCNSVSEAHNPSVQGLLGSLGINVAAITGQVGVSCVSVTGIGAGTGGDCSQQPVCCNNDTFNGVVALGCNPIDADA